MREKNKKRNENVPLQSSSVLINKYNNHKTHYVHYFLVYKILFTHSCLLYLNAIKIHITETYFYKVVLKIVFIHNKKKFYAIYTKYWQFSI